MLFSEKQMIKHTYQQTKTFQEKSRDIDCNMQHMICTKQNLIQW